MSVSRAAIRRGGVPALALFAGVALIAGAVGLAVRIPGHSVLPGLARHGDAPSYSRDALGSIAPVSAAFVEGRIGKAVLDRLTGNPEPAAPGNGTHPPPRSGPGPHQGIRGTAGPVPGLAPGGWVLALDMTADAYQVRAGDEIVYRIVVSNVGPQDFRGRAFALEWHTPLGTVSRNPLTQCTLLPVMAIRALCQSQRLAVFPGGGDARHDQMNSAGLIAIAAGDKWVQTWYAQVLPGTAAGTQYTNHAHLHVNVDGQDRTISTPPVVVTVVA